MGFAPIFSFVFLEGFWFFHRFILVLAIFISKKLGCPPKKRRRGDTQKNVGLILTIQHPFA